MGPCDGPWCDQQKKTECLCQIFPTWNRNKLNFPSRKPHILWFYIPLWPLPSRLSQPLCASGHPNLMYLSYFNPLPFSNLQVHDVSFFFPACWGGNYSCWNFMASGRRPFSPGTYSGWQRPNIWAPTTDLLLLQVNYCSRSSVRCRFRVVGEAARCGSRHGWASRGWRAAVNTLALR